MPTVPHVLAQLSTAQVELTAQVAGLQLAQDQGFALLDTRIQFLFEQLHCVLSNSAAAQSASPDGGWSPSGVPQDVAVAKIELSDSGPQVSTTTTAPDCLSCRRHPDDMLWQLAGHVS